MPLNVQCKRCANLRNDWCDKKCDSLDTELVRDCQYYRTLTNYDRIVSKTPEELADWLNAVLTSNVAPYAAVRGANKRDKLLDWLRQEVHDGT